MPLNRTVEVLKDEIRKLVELDGYTLNRTVEVLKGHPLRDAFLVVWSSESNR